MRKNLITFGISLLVATSVLAGGSIFKSHKTRTYNPDGVSSVGVYVCGSLECPPVRIVEGDCDTIPNATRKFGVCVCNEGYVAYGEKCKSQCEVTPIEGCSVCEIQEGKPTCTACQDGYVLEDNQCIAKCHETGTCEGDTCKNAGDYPHCWYQCKCPESVGMEGASICACANDLDKIVCSYYVCMAPTKEGDVCKCSEHGGESGTGANACACADDESKIACGDYACVAPKEGEVCRCSVYGSNENACACAEDESKIACGDYA